MSEKPARRIAEIPEKILADLNAGRRESRNLVEGLAIDFRQLLFAAAPELECINFEFPAAGILQRMAFAGTALYHRFGRAGIERFAKHPSDTVRGWAAYMIGGSTDYSLKERLDLIRRLADDPHFGVREWAWLAVRPAVVARTEEAVRMLTPWTAEPSANLRRFASELTRPRGVWCAHLTALKTDPELGLSILEPLRSDPAKYVQDSVANWLNDAGKTQPKWVTTLCRRWRKESPTPETERICKRATRNL
jgi:3-methyladenine DNA glycosylase AlkC